MLFSKCQAMQKYRCQFWKRSLFITSKATMRLICWRDLSTDFQHSDVTVNYFFILMRYFQFKNLDTHFIILPGDVCVQNTKLRNVGSIVSSKLSFAFPPAPVSILHQRLALFFDAAVIPTVAKASVIASIEMFVSMIYFESSGLFWSLGFLVPRAVFLHFCFQCPVLWQAWQVESFAGQWSLPGACHFVQLPHVNSFLFVFWTALMAFVDRPIDDMLSAMAM